MEISASYHIFGMNLYKTVFIKTLPVMAGYTVLGAAFGILLKVNGYGLIWAFAMSFFIFAGSMQFVGISLLTGGVSFISVAITTLMVNARHLLYGISMIERYKGAGIRKPYLIHTLTDETYSLVCNDDVPDGINPHKYYFFISLINHIYWITGSILGSFLGSIIPFSTKGIDFVMTAFFVTVFVDQWMKTGDHKPAFIGVICSLICLMIFGSDKFLIPSMVAIIGVLSLICQPKKMEAENE